MSAPLLALAVFALAFRQDPPKPAAKPTSPAVLPLEVRAFKPDGTSEVVALESLAPKELAARGAISVRATNAGAPSSEVISTSRAVLELSDGERWSGRVRGGKGDALDFELSAGARLRLGVDALARLVFPARVSDSDEAALEAPKSGDRLFRKGGERMERIDGTFESFGEDGVAFDSVLGKKVFPWSEVAALYVESLQSHQSAKRAERTVVDPAVWLDLVDGTRLRVAWKGADAKGLTLERAGEALSVAWSWLDELVFDDGRIAFLSDLEPARVDERSPFGDELGLRFPHHVDRSVSGRSLRAGGKVWNRGLGVHAPSRLTWTLDGSWKELRGAVALDDEVLQLPGKGSIRFRVWVDGKTAWESAVLHAGDAPVELPGISLAGAHEVALEADAADNLHVADRGDWLRIVLVRGR